MTLKTSICLQRNFEQPRQNRLNRLRPYFSASGRRYGLKLKKDSEHLVIHEIMPTSKRRLICCHTSF